MPRKPKPIPGFPIARPLMKAEIDAKRIHFAALNREELEVLLVRAASKIEVLDRLFSEARKMLLQQRENKKRGPEKRLEKDEKQVIKRACEAVFYQRFSERVVKRGDRAQFIREMAEEHQDIEDPRTFGTWWDEWSAAMRRSGPAPVNRDPAWVDYAERRDAAYNALPQILRTLGFIPKDLPKYPYDPD